MATKDIHEKPFDETALVKLEIFERYAQAWIPTFVMTPNVNTICIFDFFAGPGYDIEKKEGSPIRLLNKIKEQLDNIIKQKIKVHLYFNEFKEKKYLELKHAISIYLENNVEIKSHVILTIENKDFDDCLFEQIQKIREYPSLVYLDQNGVKFLKANYFNEFINMTKTDFLYFASSSYLKRFCDEEEMQGIIDVKKMKESKMYQCHRILVDEMNKKIPSSSNTKLYPFTLKKEQNHYGILFGASHPRAFDKFLNIAWEINPVNGEANYDIDKDTSGQLDLFEERTTKKVKFKQRLKELVLNKELKTNKDILYFCYNEGHPSSHGQECLKDLKNSKMINYEGRSPLVNYEQVHKNKNIINFKVL